MRGAVCINEYLPGQVRYVTMRATGKRAGSSRSVLSAQPRELRAFLKDQLKDLRGFTYQYLAVILTPKKWLGYEHEREPSEIYCTARHATPVATPVHVDNEE